MSTPLPLVALGFTRAYGAHVARRSVALVRAGAAGCRHLHATLGAACSSEAYELRLLLAEARALSAPTQHRPIMATRDRSKPASRVA